MEADWKDDLARELTKPRLRRFPRRKILSPNVDRIWTADLMDEQKYKTVNAGNRYILVVLDIFSRFAFCEPLKNKTGPVVAKAFEKIFNTSKRHPSMLYVDEGTEFYNSHMKRVCVENGIKMYSTHNEPKASIAERFIRTLRGKIEVHFIKSVSTVWYKNLQDIVNEYNSTRHRTLGMSPNEALDPKNYAEIFDKMYGDASYNPKARKFDKLKVGDKVRITIKKSIFEKGATVSWTEEIFTITEVLDSRPTTYLLQDLEGEKLEGAFYREQLQKTSQEIFRIERIIRRKTNKNGQKLMLVKYFGYPDKFNAWIPANSLAHSHNE